MTAKILWLALALTEDVPVASGSAWKSYRSPEGRYTVLFPGIPVEKRETVKTTVGPLEWTCRTVSLGSLWEYSVSESPMPEMLVQRFDARIAAIAFEKAKRGFLRRIKGTLTAEHEVALTGHPGREWRCVVPATAKREELVVIVRTYLIGTYFTTVAYQAPRSKFSTTDGAAFVDSFQASEPRVPDRQDLDWRVYASAEGGYRASFPGPPAASRLISETTSGPVPVIHHSVVREPYLDFRVCYNDMPGGGRGDPEAAYSVARDQAIRRHEGRLLGERPVVVQGIQGREIQIAVPDSIVPGGGTFWARCFVWQGRFYQVTFQSPNSTPYLEGRDTFLGSFQLTLRR
jgi:hypothetical protein